LSGIILDQVRGDLIWTAWPHMAPLFQRVAEKVPSHYTPEVILHRALTGQSALWAIYEVDGNEPLLAAAATAIRNKTVVIEALGGHAFKRWFKPMLAEFETMAKDKGFAEIEISGRLGWERLLPDFERVRVTLRKKIDG
jgi:hypothetical protein